MTSGPTRRLGAQDATNRSRLLAAAAALMIESGYPAASSRRVAARAGLKPQLVHYYFATMDDLFVEVVRRRAEAGLAALERALDAPNPLRAVWEVDRHTWVDPLGMELVALARHRPAVKRELEHYAARYRAAMITVIERTPRRGDALDEALTPALLALLLQATSRMITQEVDLGLTSGHPEAAGLVEWYLRRIDGDSSN
jgi:AcrR family transcriptional regulator